MNKNHKSRLRRLRPKNVVGYLEGNFTYNEHQLEDIERLLNMIIQNLEVSSPLPAETKTALEKPVKEVQAEIAKPKPDHSIIKGGIDTIKTIIEKTAPELILKHWDSITEALNRLPL
ncbi:MAG: hypothetical protein IPJ07_14520 [Acidobacteria bacterium]|nr:hypothetical protein [Acidobacteriota bacterium]